MNIIDQENSSTEQGQLSNLNTYSCISEKKIIASFKRFIDEKKKNSFRSSNIVNPQLSIRSELKDEDIPFQSQLISCYYSLDKEEQDNFWYFLENDSELQNELSNLEGLDFYNKILLEISKYFNIQRNSPALEPYLTNNILYAYNNCGDRIYIDKVLRFDDEQHVAEGYMTKYNPKMCFGGNACANQGDQMKCERWVVKWNVKDNGFEVTETELENWKKIENSGASVPNVLDGFKILDFNVLVMEKLEQLEPQDYNQKLVMSITSFLEKIIPLGVLNNLKPSNILKRVTKSYSQMENTYFVADVAGMTTEPKSYGFKRYTWSPMWASQVVDSETITTVKNDLIEFGYVLNWLSRGDTLDLETIENVRIIERPKEVYDWIEMAQNMNEQDIKMKDWIELKKIAFQFPPISKSELCKK